MEHDHSQPVPPEEDFQIARAVYERGEISHALFHLGNALCSNPEQPEWLALLDEIIEEGHAAPEDVKPDEKGGMHYAQAAIRAYIFAHRDDYDDAINLIIQIHQVAPEPIYLPWVVQWLTVPENIRRVELKRLIAFVAGTTGRIPPRNASDNPVYKEQMTKLLPALEAIMQVHPTEGMLMGFISSIYRKLGQLQYAMKLADRGFTTQPGEMTAIFKAGVHREMGEITQAVELFKQAYQYNPTHYHVKLDIADLLTENGQTAEGLHYYEDVLQLEPRQPWAYPSALYYRAMLDPKSDWHEDLVTYAEANPENDRATSLMEALIRQRDRQEPYVKYLPEPAEATINMLRQVMQSPREQFVKPGSKDKVFRVGLSSLESPSSALALATYLHELDDIRLALSASVQMPDPRQPIVKGRYSLWNFEGDLPVPALPPPDETIAEHVAVLAARPFDIDDWKAQARKIGTKLGAKAIPDMLATMVRPPTRPLKTPYWLWLHHVQVAAALIIAYSESTWDGSERRSALLSVALGPMDWTTEAAIIALTQLALDDAAIRAEVIKVFQRIIEHRPSEGAVCYEKALVHCALMLPALPTDMRARLEEVKGWMSES